MRNELSERVLTSEFTVRVGEALADLPRSLFPTAVQSRAPYD